MKIIFECETELGRCDGDRINGHFGENAGDWVALAHTIAAMTSAHGMLRIEQRCYLRSTERADDVRPQTWVRSEMNLEPMLGSSDETKRMVQQLHRRFVDSARQVFTEQSLLTAPHGVCEA